MKKAKKLILNNLTLIETKYTANQQKVIIESCFLKKIDPEKDYSPKGKFRKGSFLKRKVPDKDPS